MSFRQRLEEIRTGFERPFWVANVTELFERLSYYAAFASLARYLVETLKFPVQQASSLAGLFGGAVWVLAAFGGGSVADRLGFRRALSVAYLILSISYFLLGSLASDWLAPVRTAMPLTTLVIVLLLPAFGIALVKPSVVGTTARASKENVRSIGYSIYYTLVNIGGALGPYVASWAHKQFKAETVFLIAALSVFMMFFAVLIFFKEPSKEGERETATVGQAARNFVVVISNFRFMLFLAIFSGYWIVFWQEFTTLPLYVSKYIDPNADTALLLATGPIIVISLTMVASIATRKMPAFRAITLGTVLSGLAWLILIWRPSVPMVVATLIVVSLGEITQSPRYYDYISRLAPSGQQGTYMGFAFLPIGIGSFVGGPLGGWLLHHYGEELHRPEMVWWVIVAIGAATAILLFLYDRIFLPSQVESAPN